MKKFTCPYCYEKHSISTSPLECSYQIKGDKKACISNVEKDSNGLVKHSKDKSKCLKCTAGRKVVKCEITGDEIPSDFLSNESLSIALLGASASGKSNYIGVLINEIRKKMTGNFNCTLSISSSDKSKEYYMEYYYKPLFVDGYVVDATTTQQEAIPPLVFPLRFLDKKNHITNTAALSFYDTAGENLDATEDILVNNRYIPNADGIILLLDPLQITSIRERLKDKIPLPAQYTDVVEILSRIVQNIRDVKNIKGQIKAPLALAFTKIDVLEKFDILKEDSCLREESEHLRRGVFVQSDFESVNIEMQDLLENLLDNELIQQMKQFEKFAFFGVTSLGDIPKGAKLANKIAPRRVLDPLLWILAENKYIKSVKR